MMPLIFRISKATVQPRNSVYEGFMDEPTLEDFPARSAPSSIIANFSGAETRLTKIEAETTDDE